MLFRPDRHHNLQCGSVCGFFGADRSATPRVGLGGVLLRRSAVRVLRCGEAVEEGADVGVAGCALLPGVLVGGERAEQVVGLLAEDEAAVVDVLVA